MSGPTTQPKQNVMINNTTKTKCQDQQTQTKQNARTYNITKSNKMSGPTTQPGLTNRKQNKKLLDPNNNFFRSIQGMNCRRARIKFSTNQLRASTSHGWAQPSEVEQPCGTKICSDSESSPTNHLSPWAPKTRTSNRSHSFWDHK